MPHIDNGQWFCPDSVGLDDKMKCHLSCHPGYSMSTNESTQTIYCNENNQWTPNPGNFFCEPSVALIIGGVAKEQKEIFISEMELYTTGENCSKLLNNSIKNKHQSSAYYNGKVITCGGYSYRLECFFYENNTWNSHSELSKPKSESFKLITALGNLYAVDINHTEEYDEKTKRWNSRLDLNYVGNNYNCIAKINESHILIMGGGDEAVDKNPILIDLLQGKVANTSLPNINFGRFACISITLRGVPGILAAGGNERNDTSFLALQDNKWSRKGKTASTQESPRFAELADETVVLFEGEDSESRTEVYSKKGGSWSIPVQLKKRRAYYSVVPVPYTMFPDCSV